MFEAAHAKDLSTKQINVLAHIAFTCYVQESDEVKVKVKDAVGTMHVSDGVATQKC